MVQNAIDLFSHFFSMTTKFLQGFYIPGTEFTPLHLFLGIAGLSAVVFLIQRFLYFK